MVASGYDRRSLIALALLVGVGGAVGYRWSDLIDASGGMDWLLLGTWIWMAGLLTWGISARRDVLLLGVGLVGGGVIEWWGTNTRLWTYFTAERPPLWILPAWPIASLAIDRMARVVDRALVEVFGWRRELSEGGFFFAYWLMVPAFVVSMIAFARHSVGIEATQVVIALMCALTLHCPNPRRDVLVFVAGSVLGIFLEYWGTSRQCWTYYTGEVPPAVATVAHGFAAMAFARGADGLERLLGAIYNPRTPARTALGRAFRAPRGRNAAHP